MRAADGVATAEVVAVEDKEYTTRVTRKNAET